MNKLKNMNKINKCKEIKEIMVDYLSGEFSGVDSRAAIMENHLQQCSSCMREYVFLKNIFHETQQIDREADAVMAAIDWEENARDISLGVQINQIRRRSHAWTFSLLPWNWKLAIPALVAVFILGICLGYFLFYQAHQKSLPVDELLKQDDNMLMQRLETALTRREMQGYFLQTQLLLTDVMRQCNEDGTSSWSSGINRQRVQVLLNKNRYFNEDISNPELLSTRRLLKKIEWLLFEMMEINDKDNASCRQLQRLQDYIRKEKLLLKLRLVGKDISYSEV